MNFFIIQGPVDESDPTGIWSTAYEEDI